MSRTVKPYWLIGIVRVRHLVMVCNLKGNAPDIAISNSNNVFFSSKRDETEKRESNNNNHASVSTSLAMVSPLHKATPVAFFVWLKECMNRKVFLQVRMKSKVQK